MKYKFEELVNHLKQYGFFYKGSEIYGGLLNTWDYGPLGVEMKIKLKKIWWESFVNNFDFNYGIDSSILMNTQVWKASGHLSNFSDQLVDCKNCNYRFAADKLIEKVDNKIAISELSNDEINNFLSTNNIKCPNCNKKQFTSVRNFELMFKVKNGITSDDSDVLYLRPETAQGIFVNFKNIQRTMSAKLPFGVCQTGKSFRNEITPGNFIFRTREFEQMELEFFYSKYDKTKWFDFWLQYIQKFLINTLGINEKNLFIKEHSKNQLAHYSNRTVDFEYYFPFGKSELWGLADRGDFDLLSHQKYSNSDLQYFDEQNKTKYYPYVIEPSVGVERLLLAILCDAFTKETVNNSERIVLKINKNIAPIQICILPLLKKEELINPSKLILDDLKKIFTVRMNIIGSIGKRYRKEDAIGTPFCITYDFNSLTDGMVTIRNRDTMEQQRIAIASLKQFLLTQFEY